MAGLALADVLHLPEQSKQIGRRPAAELIQPATDPLVGNRLGRVVVEFELRQQIASQLSGDQAPLLLLRGFRRSFTPFQSVENVLKVIAYVGQRSKQVLFVVRRELEFELPEYSPRYRLEISIASWIRCAFRTNSSKASRVSSVGIKNVRPNPFDNDVSSIFFRTLIGFDHLSEMNYALDFPPSGIICRQTFELGRLLSAAGRCRATPD